MTKDYGVTDGHELYSLHRFREDVRHMIIFDDLIAHDHHRVRLYLTEEGYALTQKASDKGLIRIIHHTPVIEGNFVQDIPKPKRKRKRHFAR